MRDFEYFRPQTIHEALTLYKKGGAGAKLLAGGTELVNEMRLGKAQPEQVIDLKSIPELDFMKLDSDGLKIGALYRVRDAETSLALRQSPYSALSHAAGVLGSPQVRNKATIVGNLCRCSPSADLIPPLMAMNARAHIKVDGAERIMAVEDMPLGPGKTALMPGDIVTELDIPRMPAYAGCSYYKVSPAKIARSGSSGRGRLPANQFSDLEMRGCPHRSWRSRTHRHAREKGRIHPYRFYSEPIPYRRSRRGRGRGINAD